MNTKIFLLVLLAITMLGCTIGENLISHQKVRPGWNPLDKIEELSLAPDTWSAFSRKMQRFTNLRVLFVEDALDCNDLDRITCLPNLTYLNFQSSTCDSFPDSFAELKNIKSLVMSIGDRNTISPVIFRLQSLVNLEIVGYSMEQCPVEISELINLEKLSLYETTVREIPDEVWKMPNLKQVTLSGIQQKDSLLKYARQLNPGIEIICD